MNNILVLFAHPRYEESRINQALVSKIQSVERVTFHDLYEEYPDFNIDVAYEKKLLQKHEVVVWQHPLYWYSCPPLMKQWIDVVLEYGWAYGAGGKALAGKQCLSAITAGGSLEVYCSSGRNIYSINEFLRPFEQTARLCGMNYLPPFVVTGTYRLSDERLQEYASQYAAALELMKHNLSVAQAENCDFLNDIPQLSKLAAR